jgi:hypothetical protein
MFMIIIGRVHHEIKGFERKREKEEERLDLSAGSVGAAVLSNATPTCAWGWRMESQHGSWGVGAPFIKSRKRKWKKMSKTKRRKGGPFIKYEQEEVNDEDADKRGRNRKNKKRTEGDEVEKEDRNGKRSRPV